MTDDDKIVKEKNLPKCKKLGANGDIYTWMKDMELHFRAVDLWEYFTEDNIDRSSKEGRRKEARCQRDILHTLEEELNIVVRHKSTAAKMYSTIKRFFVGGKVAETSALHEKISQIKYEGDYFLFLSTYQSYVTQLINVDDKKHGFLLLTMQFLNKLPKSLSTLTHPLKQNLEIRKDDGEKVWMDTFDSIQDYLLDSGLLTVRKLQDSGQMY